MERKKKNKRKNQIANLAVDIPKQVEWLWAGEKGAIGKPSITVEKVVEILDFKKADDVLLCFYSIIMEKEVFIMKK